MDTGRGKGPREDFSSFLNKNVIRNEHWMMEGSLGSISHQFLIRMQKEMNTGGGKGDTRAFSSISNKDVIRNGHWRKGRAPREHFSSSFKQECNAR